MRLFGIESDGGLTPYPRSAFDEGEAIIEDWLESNPRAVLEDDPLLLIGRQVRTDRGKRIDLLGVDRAGSVVVVELKRGRTPRDVVAQALEYAAFAARLDVDDLEKLLCSYENDESLGLADRHGEHFGIRELVAFNKDQRIVIVGQPVAPEVRQVASFLSSKGIGVACVEFNLFEERGGGGRLLSMEVVAGDETTKPGPVVSDSRPVLTEARFLELCDEQAKSFFSRLFEGSRRPPMPSINWTSAGFTMRVDIDGEKVQLGQYRRGPDWVVVVVRRKLVERSAVPPTELDALWTEARRWRFIDEGDEPRNLVCNADADLTDAEMKTLLGWFSKLAGAVRRYGVKAKA